MGSPTGPITVALLAPYLPPGGAERQMLYLAGALPRDEFDVRFILLSERGPLADEAEQLGLRVDVLGLGRQACRSMAPACLASIPRVLAAYRRLTRGVDIVDAWLVPAYTFAGLIQPFVRVPVLLAGRRSLLDVERTRRWYRELAGSMAMRSVAGVVANSQAAADQAVGVEGIDPGRVHVIRNAVVPVSVSHDGRQSLRSAWGTADEDIVVGCIGTLQPGKGHALLLDVAERLMPRQPGLRFVFIGDGPLRETIDRDIAARGLREHVRLHTHETDARGCYAALDIVVQASDSEGMPNVVLEAASAARAIVATDVGGTREIITSGVSGILVPKGDPIQMADGIERVATSEELRAELGSSAARRSLDFSVDRLALETASLYRRLLHRNREPSLHDDVRPATP